MPIPDRSLLTRLALGVAALLLSGCAGNPWRDAYVGFAPGGGTAMVADEAGHRNASDAPPAVLELVEFEEATADRAEPGHEALGFANFTGTYYRGVEDDLRRQARAIGATRVAWGLRYLHTERETVLRPVQDVWTSRRRGAYDPKTGRYRERDVEYTRVRYVPEVYDNAFYAFRAVFYRDAGGAP